MDYRTRMPSEPLCCLTRGLFVLACGMATITGCAEDRRAKGSSELGGGPTVRYDYDALGRLVQATAPDGNGVHYSYDAVGNITAIRRLAIDTLGVIDFAPHAGAVGSTVTVFGSGFDATAADNVVAFNGATAAV